MKIEAKKISELVTEIKDVLEGQFQNVCVEGEVTNLSLSSSGHWYFNLSDKDAAISAALFKMDALRNPHIRNLKDGDKVIATGDINVYPKRGTFQIIVKRIVPMGVGDLKEQFEKLKRRLASEGLFDMDHKKPIPLMPKKVAIITALRGAALQDFINIYKRRSLWMNLLVVPCLVQGDDAPRALRQALFNTIKFSMEVPEHEKVDLIVLARGGGSLEDLWAFNDEGLAYDIFNCPIPVISAIGHEVDFSISDFVADLRCETPSAAAEVITQYQTQIKERLFNAKNKLLIHMDLKSSRLENRLKRTNPHSILSLILGKYSQYQMRLKRSDIRNRLNELTRIHDIYLALDGAIEDILAHFKHTLLDLNHKVEGKTEVLKALNPNNVLGRGYTYLRSSDEKVVATTKDFDRLKNSKIKINFADGVREVNKGSDAV